MFWRGHAHDLWVGVYGTAKVKDGDPLAVTSDGQRHPLT